MKRKPLILVAFLMVLCIATPFFGASYDGAVVLMEPNPRKDFMLSDAWNEAGNASFDIDTPGWLGAGNASFDIDTYPYGIDTEPQSIDGFEETLLDDVFHYPDSIYFQGINANGDILYGDYNDTFLEDDTYYFVCSSSNAVDSFIEIDGPSTWGMANLTLDWQGLRTAGTGTPTFYWYIYNWTSSGYDTIYSVSTIDTTEELRNEGFEWSSAYTNSTGHSLLYFYGNSSGDTIEIGIDFLELELMTLADSDHYAESFADVSDWVNVSASAMGTDGDVMYIDIAGDSVYDYWYTNTPSFAANSLLYYEYSIARNASATNVFVSVVVYSEDDQGGTVSSIDPNYYVSSTDYVTRRGFFSLDVATESLRIRAKNSNPSKLYLDYFRIGPADEMGWQHDGSTTEGIASGARDGWTYNLTTDGDILSLGFSRSGGSSTYGQFFLVYDTTTTKTNLNVDYYPMLTFNMGGTGTNNGFAIFPYIGGKVSANASEYVGGGIIDSPFDEGIFTMNVNAMSSSSASAYLRIICYGDSGDSGILAINYTKVFSIANYTVTQSGTSTDDILYVTDGVLYCEGTSFTDITLDRDPALNITYPYYGWGLNSSLGIPQVDFYNASGYWVGYSSETQGFFPYASIITDVRFKFTDSANIISLTFFDSTAWRDSGIMDMMMRIKSWFSLVTVIVSLIIAVFTGSLDAFLILVGLILIPVSVLYLVRGGKDEMSFDKVAIFSVVIFLGIGLFIGGIIP